MHLAIPAHDLRRLSPTRVSGLPPVRRATARRTITLLATCCSALSLASELAAAEQDIDTPLGDAGPSVESHARTFLRFFQRALLPGPHGSLVHAETIVPIYQYYSVRVRGVDAPWQAKSFDAEVAAWGNYQFADSETEHAFDGDVTTAHLTARLDPVSVRIGRQALSAGAARYVRFDGVTASASAPRLGRLEAYAGYTVLPRWDGRPGYALLGSPVESLVRDPQALPDVQRSGYWMRGARLEFEPDEMWLAAVSLHDEREASEVARQQLGLDVRLRPSAELVASGQTIMDLERKRIAETRVFVDYIPSREWLVDVEYLRTRPSLYLSRQSVLSVFGADAFDEAGAQLSYQPLSHLSAKASGHVEHYFGGEFGARGELELRSFIDEAQRLNVLGSYGRVFTADNGYHALRSSLSYRLSPSITAVAEAYWYLYDRAIAQHQSSSVYASNLQWHVCQSTDLLWGVSLAESPYAESDLQTLIRATHEFSAGGGL